MKTEKSILIAFVLNLGFSIFECIGGILTGSIAIISDALHDLGDACSIGISYFLEKKSRKKPDADYTYGYGRYSVIGSLITTMILIFGSIAVICGAAKRLINPIDINYNGMIIFAVIGILVNGLSVFFTHGGHSLNQKAVNLHMLEDVLGWIVVLVGAVIMRFTNIAVIDPILSIAMALFILINAIGNLREIIEVFLEKTPQNISVSDIEKLAAEIDGVISVHHIHIWSLDGRNIYLTMHVVANGDPPEIKKKLRKKLEEHGICHATLELEEANEHCNLEDCEPEEKSHYCVHHHHHHH